MIDSSIYKRLARTEAAAAAQKAETMEVLQRAYKNACLNRDFEDAALLARKIRDKLLDETDKEVALDRLSLDTSSAVKFLATLKTIFSGEWAKYRQALRDISVQPGFPFDVSFPTPPGTDDKEKTEVEK